MTMVKHELKMGRNSFLIWTSAIGFLLTVCVFLFPEMKGQMDGVSDVFASMGSFTEAFGMDRLNFGTLVGFYAIECGNVLGLGGAFYASLCAVGVLSKEEKDKTAEFLLAHPVSRTRIITEKLIAVFIQITVLNLIMDRQLKVLIQYTEQTKEATAQFQTAMETSAAELTGSISRLITDTEKQVGRMSESCSNNISMLRSAAEDKLEKHTNKLFWISLIPSAVLIVLELMRYILSAISVM
ncbi:MAG: ABC transporter permease subunit [Clostridia bacterium]|nr:ABC transporter permease subunit [Clostridia bacterium]